MRNLVEILMKNCKKLNWYISEKNEIEYKSVLFVPVTKGGTLAKELKKREEEINKKSEENPSSKPNALFITHPLGDVLHLPRGRSQAR